MKKFHIPMDTLTQLIAEYLVDTEQLSEDTADGMMLVDFDPKLGIDVEIFENPSLQ